MDAEEEGFEPPVRFHARRFSRPVHSTSSATLPDFLRRGKNTLFFGFHNSLNKKDPSFLMSLIYSDQILTNKVLPYPELGYFFF